MTTGQDKRDYDHNGWFEIKDTPLSLAGVFQFKGSSLGLTGEDAEKIFNVYRPAEELSRAETIQSFRLLPWVDDHTMIGPTAEQSMVNAAPAEKKGVHGVVGEDVNFKDGALYGNIKCFSEEVAEKVKLGKKELSVGYFCDYEKQSGVFNGLQYDYVQRNILANHLALVWVGRMGPTVAVGDQDEILKGARMEEQLKALLESIAALTAKVDAVSAKVEALTVEEKTEPMGDQKQAAETKAEVPAADKKPEGGMDAAEIAKQAVQEYKAKNELAERLSKVIGTFDHADLTHAQVVEKGIKELKLQAPKGGEAAMLNGYLLAIKPKQESGMDQSTNTQPQKRSSVDAYLEGK
jgi:hypothetical protein